MMIQVEQASFSLSEYLHCVEMVRTFKSLSSGTAKGLGMEWLNTPNPKGRKSACSKLNSNHLK
jgi:hypothetical protein